MSGSISVMVPNNHFELGPREALARFPSAAQAER